MTTALKFSNWALLLLMCGAATAQESPPPAPPKSNAQSEAGEPRATLSPAAEAPSDAVPAKAASSGSTATRTAVRTSTPGAATSASAPRPGAKSPGAADRLSLGAATVTGDHEQPKVLYIVPWKGSNIGDLSGKPMNSLLDEALAPVDREEFKREVAYFDAVRSNTPQNAAANPPANQGEK